MAVAFAMVMGALVTTFLITSSPGDSRTTGELPTLMQLPTEELSPTVAVTDPPSATDPPSPTNTVQLAPTTTVPPTPTATETELVTETAAESIPQSQPVAIQITLPPLEQIITPTQAPALPLPVLPLEPVPNQVIIRFEADASAPMREQYLAQIGGTIQQRIDTLDMIVVTLPEGVAEQPLPDSPVVVRSEPDYYVAALTALVPDDPLYPQQWALPVIGAPEAWGEFPADAPLVSVAVIDSGVCADHPDLVGRTLEGWDFVESDADPQDDYGHGCGVAGIIAANTNDGVGMAGVAPNARIMPLRVLNAQGIGTYSDVAAAIVYAVDNGAQVINLSLGGAFPSTLLQSAIDHAVAQDVTVVAAAGNTGGSVLYPAAYAPVIAVASIDPDLQRSSFSSYGPEIDLLAPGRDILTTARDGSYVTVSGTSFAAPHVAGVAAVEMARTDTSNTVVGVLLPTSSLESTEGHESSIVNHEPPLPAYIDEASAIRVALEAHRGSQIKSQLFITPINTVGDWTFGIVAVAVLDNSDGAPESYLYISRQFPSKIEVGFEYTGEFGNLLTQAPNGLISEAARSAIVFNAQGIGDSQLSLPWQTGESWNFTSGPHADGFQPSPNTLSALDFSGGSGQIRAAREGIAYVPCANYVRIDHPDGWRTGYYHVSNITINNGTQVARGTHLGNQSALYGCGGGANGVHLHFALWRNGQQITIDGHDIGGWTVRATTAYNGTMTRIADNTVRTACASGCTGVSRDIYNDGSVGSGGGGSPSSGCGSYSYSGVVLFDETECRVTNNNKREYNSAGFRSMPSVDFNDRASSIHVASGWSVRIWNDDREDSPNRCISGSMYDLSRDKYEGTETVINNTITWVEVFSNTSCSRSDPNSVVTLYANSQLTGTGCFITSAGFANICSGSNDSTSSIRIKAGWSARVWNDGDRQGPSRCFYGYVSNLAGEQYNENGTGVIDNTISSFAAYNQSNCPTWPIPAPTNLQATVIGTTQINLSWQDNSSDETYFQIERSLNGTQWSSIASTSASTYSSTGLNCGTDYHFRVKAYRSLDTAYSGVSNTVTARTHACAQPPANDDFGSATNIASMPYSVTINTTDATKASDDSVPSCAPSTGKSVWYRYTPTSNHRIALDTYGSSFNTTLSVWTGTRGSLTQRACNDDEGGTVQSELNLAVTSGTTYYIMVGGNTSTSGGSLKLNGKADGTPPNVQIVNPQPGNAFSGNQLSIEATASDSGSGVKDLLFFIGYDDGTGAAGASIETSGLPQPPEILEEVSAQGWGWHRWLWDTESSDGWKVTFDVSSVPDQEIAVWVFAYDYVGNQNQHSFSGVFIDRTPPNSMVGALAPSSPLNFSVSWSGNDAVSGISSYDVQMRVNGGAWTDWVTGTTTTSKSVSANGVASYEFRSRARDRAGNVEAWPTNADASTTTVVPAPAVPTGLTTIGNLSSAPASPTYRWNQVANATDYSFGLALGSGQWLHQSSYNAASICSNGVCQVTPQVPLGEGAYFWRVAGINAGTWGNYTPNQQFSVTVNTAAGPFSITYPSADSYVRGAEVQPFFRWTASSNAHTYEILLVDRTIGATIYSAYLTPAQLSCGTECVLTAANYPVMLTTQHEYNLRVKAIAPSGDYTAASRFFTLYPGYPQQISPIPGTDLSLQPVLTWAHVEGTDGYRIIIKTLQGVVYGKWGFYAPAQLCSGTTCTFDLRSLPGGGQAFLNYGKYTWQILAVNAYGRVKTDAWYFRVR